MENYSDWTSAQHQAAAEAFGRAVKTIYADDSGIDIRFAAAVAGSLAAQAAHHANLAEEENDRMARVLMAQVSYGTGAPLTDEEIARANEAHCRACSSIPCRCKGDN